MLRQTLRSSRSCIWVDTAVGTFQYEQNIYTSSADVFYLMNRISPPGERQVSRGVGGNCCFWREACFLLGMGDVFNLSLLKAQHDPEILSGGKKATPGSYQRGISTQCSPKM